MGLIVNWQFTDGGEDVRNERQLQEMIVRQKSN
jgi:hypothetical protein